MADNWVKVDFTCQNKHIGFEVEFYDEPDDLQLAAEESEAHAKAHDTAPIFINTDNEKKSAAQLLDRFLLIKEASLFDFVPPEKAEKALNEGVAVFPFTFPCDCERGNIRLNTTKGLMDAKYINLFIEFTVKPKRAD